MGRRTLRWLAAAGTLLRGLNHPVVPFAVATIFYHLFIWLYLSRNHYDASLFVCAGDKFCNREEVSGNLTVLGDSDGYDGEFYYRLALDPFTSRGTDFGVTLDKPSYRHQRILYPLLVWSLSGGDSQMIPAIMIGVNFIAVLALAWLGGVYARQLHQHALWGLLFPFYPGFLFSLSLNLTEILASVLLLVSLLLLRLRWLISATAFLTAAMLTRETALFAAVAGLLAWTYEHWKRAPRERMMPWHYWFAPFAVCAVWQVVLNWNWGQFPILGNDENWLTFPLSGYRDVLARSLRRPVHGPTLCVSGFMPLCLAVTLTCFRTGGNALRHYKVGWGVCFVTIFSLAGGLWANHWAYLRVFTELYLFGALIVLHGGTKAKIVLLSASASVWGLVFCERLGLLAF